MMSLCKFKSGIKKKSTDEEDGMTPVVFSYYRC